MTAYTNTRDNSVLPGAGYKDGDTLTTVNGSKWIWQNENWFPIAFGGNPEEQPLTVRRSDGGVVVPLPDGTGLSLTDGNNIAFIGDSRMRYGHYDWYKRCEGLVDYKGLFIDYLGFGPAQTSNAFGTFDYRASDKSVRWTAPGDTPGPWTPLTKDARRQQVESGTYGKWLKFVLRNWDYIPLPATDQTFQLECKDSLYAKTVWTSRTTQVESYFRGGPKIYRLGAGGAVLAGVVDSLSWYNSVAAGAGIDVFAAGTNDISNIGTWGFSKDTMIGYAKTFIDSRLAVGRKIVVCGEGARWGNDGVSAMTAGQLAALTGYNAWLASYCASKPQSLIYVDLYSLSADPAYTDGRPAAGILSDAVHDGPLGSYIYGMAIAAAIEKIGAIRPAAFPQRGDSSILMSAWMMTGTGGTPSTGTSGQLPTGYTGIRSAGTDATAVFSIVGYPDHNGRRIQGVYTGTTGAQTINVNMASSVPSAIGLAAGDWAEAWVDCEVDAGATGITEITSYVFIGGGLGARNQVTFPVELAGKGILRARLPALKIESAYTALQPVFSVVMSGAASATIKFGEPVWRKISNPGV